MIKHYIKSHSANAEIQKSDADHGYCYVRRRTGLQNKPRKSGQCN
jgi:hypothetical protein